MPRSILVVEDDDKIRELLVHYLRKEGFATAAAADGETGLARARAGGIDLVVLDLLLPGLDGFEVLRRLRQAPETAAVPVVVLTARDGETDRIVGLELGADDYVGKPFSPRELVARIRAVLRRSGGLSPGEERGTYRYGDLELSVERHEVRCGGRTVPLTATEFRVLLVFLAAPGRLLSRDAILKKAWGDDTHVTDRTVDVHVAKIRRKIPLLAEAIETVRDAGYRLREA